MNTGFRAGTGNLQAREPRELDASVWLSTQASVLGFPRECVRHTSSRNCFQDSPVCMTCTCMDIHVCMACTVKLAMCCSKLEARALR